MYRRAGTSQERCSQSDGHLPSTVDRPSKQLAFGAHSSIGSCRSLGRSRELRCPAGAGVSGCWSSGSRAVRSWRVVHCGKGAAKSALTPGGCVASRSPGDFPAPGEGSRPVSPNTRYDLRREHLRPGLTCGESCGILLQRAWQQLASHRNPQPASTPSNLPKPLRYLHVAQLGDTISYSRRSGIMNESSSC